MASYFYRVGGYKNIKNIQRTLEIFCMLGGAGSSSPTEERLPQLHALGSNRWWG